MEKLMGSKCKSHTLKILLTRSLFLIPFICFQLWCQNTQNKIGGVCFRIDDNHPISRWKEYSEVFEKYGFKFTFGINVAYIETQKDYIECIKELILAGHEFADHTPNHVTHWFTTSEPEKYKDCLGVHHILNNKVAIKYESFDTTNKYFADGIVDIKDNMMISHKNGGFREINPASPPFAAVYIPKNKMVLSYSKYYNVDSSNVDTLYLESFWNEPITIENENNVYVKFISNFSVRMSSDGLLLLGQRSLESSSSLRITRPVTWLQPGGGFPQLNSFEVKKAFGDNNSFICGAVYPNPSYKCYNEYNPNHEKEFSMQWGDFYPERSYFSEIKKIIAEKVAKHYLVIGSGHFSNSLGGWDDFLLRMDSLLNWIAQYPDKILVKTYSEWAKQLYSVSQNPYTNVFPSLGTDIDDDGLPDGYIVADGIIDRNDGVSESNFYSFKINKKGTICSISRLAGLEKGENDFSLWTKGEPGDSIEVIFTFSEKNLSSKFKFPASTSSWTKYNISQSVNGNSSLIIPEEVSFCDIQIRCSNCTGNIVKVSGFDLHKKINAPLRIISDPDTVVGKLMNYYYKIKVLSLETNTDLKYELIDSPEWLTINNNGELSGTAPDIEGKDSIKFSVKDTSGHTDSQEYTINVVPLKKTNFESRTINLGSIRLNDTKDTIVNFANEGIDTLNIEKVYTYDDVTASFKMNRIPPFTSIPLAISIAIDSVGLNVGKIFFKTDAKDSLDSLIVIGIGTSIDDSGIINIKPVKFQLFPNYPNPFNSETILTFGLLFKSHVRLEIYNIVGQRVKVIINNKICDPGTYRTQWLGDNEYRMKVSSGVYIARIIATPLFGGPPDIAIRKIVLLK